MSFKPGQRVFWTDPDDGICSGYSFVCTDRGDLVVLTNGFEVLPEELELVHQWDRSKIDASKDQQ